MNDVWGYDWLGDDHVVETHIGRLRAKLGESARATTVLDVSGERHIGSIMLCLSRTPEGDFAGMRSRLLIDNGRTARRGTWPTGE